MCELLGVKNLFSHRSVLKPVYSSALVRILRTVKLRLLTCFHTFFFFDPRKPSKCSFFPSRFNSFRLVSHIQSATVTNYIIMIVSITITVIAQCTGTEYSYVLTDLNQTVISAQNLNVFHCRVKIKSFI